MQSRRRSWLVSRPAAIMLVLGVAAAAGCSTGASPSPSVGAASPSAAASPSPAPSRSPSPSPDPSPSPSPTCAVAIDRQPDWGVTFYVSGTGFAPEADLKATFNSPSGTSTLGGPGEATQPRLIHTTADGRFGPWDIVYFDPRADEGGDYELEFTDGDCTATVAFTLPVSDGAPAPIRCQLTLDRVPDWGVQFNVGGHFFPADSRLAITIDEPFSSVDWQWPGLPRTSAQGEFGPLDLRYSEPVAGDGGDYIVTATAGDCTATLTFTLPEP